MVKQKAFTLAEVLITLGIIGIVAALTLPSLVESYKEKALINKLKKVSSSLSQVHKMVLLNEGLPSEWGIPERVGGQENYDKLANIYKKYLNAQSLNIEYNTKDIMNNEAEKFTSQLALSDGTLIMFYNHYGFVNNISNNNDGKIDNSINRIDTLPNAWITVDLNWKKLPNRWGEDIFTFLVWEDNIFPYGYIGYGAHVGCLPDYASVGGKARWGSACTWWVLTEENMDYLKCSKGVSEYCGAFYRR